MTLRVYLHSKSKRTETIALLDSGATENFMSLNYAKHLHLPIKTLQEPRRLFNVDGTPNRAGDLKYYTDLGTRTGTSTRTLRYFLSDLGDSRVILGYPWFAAAQPSRDERNPLPADPTASPSNTETTTTYSNNERGKGYHPPEPGTTPSNSSLGHQQPSSAKPSVSLRPNRENSRNSSKNTRLEEPSSRPKVPTPHPSSSSKRKTENSDPSKTIDR